MPQYESPAENKLHPEGETYGPAVCEIQIPEKDSQFSDEGSKDKDVGHLPKQSAH